MNDGQPVQQSHPRADAAPPPRPVRVLIVDTAVAFGGSLAVARNLLKHLNPDLIDASLISACSDGFVAQGFAGARQVRLLAPRVDYVTLAKWKSAVTKRLRWRPLRRGLQLSVMVAELLANMPYAVRLLRAYRKAKADVVHVNNYSMEPLWAARLLGIPIIYQLHGILPSPLDGSGRRNFRHVKAFISISQAVTESAVKAGLDRSTIHHIPNFVERAADRPPPSLPAVPAIGIFGRVNRWKGQKEFLTAAMQVMPKFPTMRVYVVGDASDGDPKYLDECQEIARASRFAGQIEFTGLVSDVTEYYRKCTVVVLASIGSEGFGMVLIEAMAQARPVIASIVGATPEIVSDGVDGFLIQPGDTQSMANRISELLSDGALAARMGQNGYEKVQAQYLPSAAARKFERLYSEVAGPTQSSHAWRTTSTSAPP